MPGVDRRLFLALTSALLLRVARAQDARRAARLTPPPRPDRLPDAWTSAPAVPLWPGDPPGAAGHVSQPLPPGWPAVFVRNVARPTLRVFRPARPDRRALLVIPGGAYQFVSVANEGVDLAQQMNARGITVFVLTYRLPGEGWGARADVPLQDAQRAMRVIRAEAPRFEVDPDTISVLGFSAGGHLAATLATSYDQPVHADVDATDGVSAQPFGVALVYPVVTMLEPWTHELSRDLLLGETPSQSEIERRSAELQVNAATPPTFIVHAMDDPAVPVENSLRLVDALRKAHRPVEAHFIQEGGHAFGVGYPQTPSAHWIDLFDDWWKRLDGAAAER